MNKSRRDFLKKLPLAMSIPFTVGGMSMRAMGQTDTLTRMAAASAAANDRVLVILQMHGGNDGLNCCIPVEAYDSYYSMRPNIAIPSRNSLRKYITVDSTLEASSQIGFHPDMLGMKTLYDQGRMNVIQGVSYKNNNGSHFRGRDIWFMGGSYNDYIQSGWLGRYLKGEYEPYEYPDDFLNPAVPGNTMIDPLAIEIGSDVSLIFHQEGNIPTSLSLYNVPQFANLVDDLDGFDEDELLDPRGIPPESLAGSPYYKELHWILDLEDKSKDYSDRLAQVYQAGGATTINYPTQYPFNAPPGALKNPLSSQLQMVARLLAGGCKTKVFLVKIGGFDTHADQVENYDPTMGNHAALLYHISAGMKSFQEDLRARGLEDRVLSVTTSEFGRRVRSNGSYGTDHGTAAPMFVFGKYAKAGVIGDAYRTTPSDNLEMQYDYRVVYANIMRDWMGVAENARLNEIFPNADIASEGIMTTGTSDGTTFQPLPIVSDIVLGNEGFIGDRFSLEDCYPNPARESTTVHFKVNSAYHVSVNLMDNQGRVVKGMVSGVYAPGEHKVEVELTGLPAGNYIYELKTGFYKEAKKLVIVK